MKFTIKKPNGNVWTGSCWGIFPEFFSRDVLCELEIDDEINPQNFFDNSCSEMINIGWADEDTIFARAKLRR